VRKRRLVEGCRPAPFIYVALAIKDNFRGFDYLS
jgi:hypothetical protein